MSVSVVIPCYNPNARLFDTIASARAQSRQPVEILLADDGSHISESIEVLERAKPEVDKYIRQSNRGLGAARNSGIRNAGGSLVVPLDQDDLLHPEYIEECMRALTAHPDAAFAYSDYEVFGTRSYPVDCPEYDLYRLLDTNYLTYASLIRREAWERCGGYDESKGIYGYEDWEFWLRLGALGCYGVHVPRRLFKYRRQGPSMSDSVLPRDAELREYIRARHPELYTQENRARIKSRWSPAVCLIGKDSPAPVQTLIDLEVRKEGDWAPRAPAILAAGDGPLDSHSAELAALAVWAGHSRLELPDGALALSRKEFARSRAYPNLNTTPGVPRMNRLPASATAAGLFWRHLHNAGVLSRDAWIKHPLQSAARLIPLRVKEGINRAAGRPFFDLSFYLRFQPGSLLIAGMPQQPLEYCIRTSGKRRIALITPHLGPGGAEAILSEIAMSLRETDCELLLLATQSTDDRWSARWRNAAHHVYDLSRIVSSERMCAAIISIVSNWKCDAMLVQNTLFGYAALPHIRKCLPAVKILDFIHALDDRWDQAAVVCEVDFAIDTRVVANRIVRERLCSSGVPPGKIQMLRVGVDLARFRSTPPRTGGLTMQILFAGRLDPVKRPLLLPRIAAQLVSIRGRRDFQFVIAGDGPELPGLRESVTKARLGDLFAFRGHIDDMAPLYASCDLCVVPSRAEGLPLVILECLACARPVIASNVGAIHEAVDSECGFLVEPGEDEVRVFAERVDLLLKDPQLRQRMGDAGRRKMQSEFDLHLNRETFVRAFQ
jgi:glycosyltransferase involved in cell wall biosynthesis